MPAVAIKTNNKTKETKQQNATQNITATAPASTRGPHGAHAEGHVLRKFGPHWPHAEGHIQRKLGLRKGHMLRKLGPHGGHEEGHILRKFGLRRGTTTTKIAI